MVKSPCKECCERHPACHDSCEKFGSYKQEKKNEKAYTKFMRERSYNPIYGLEDNLLSQR